MLPKGLLLFLFNFFLLPSTNAQSERSIPQRSYSGITGGLGVSLVNATDIVDYINLGYSPLQKFDDFATAAEFFGAVDVQMEASWGLKIEYAYLLRSYNVPQSYGPDYTFTYIIHMPTIIIHYLLIGKGYLFKFGGGLGFHIARFTEDLSATETRYRSAGVGIKLEAVANTKFDENLFGYIAVDIRDNIMSDFKDSQGNTLAISAKEKNVTMNFFSLGVKFGLSYYF